MEIVGIGTGRKIKDGETIAVLSLGHPGNFAANAIEKLNDTDQIAHYDMRFLKPLDTNILHEVFSKFETVITVEDGVIEGGLGSAVIEFMNDHNYNSKVERLGVPDHFVEHGKPEELYHECGFDTEGIEKAIKKLLVPSC